MIPKRMILESAERFRDQIMRPPKSAQRFSDKIVLSEEHDPESLRRGSTGSRS